MEPVVYILAILGCHDGYAQCEPLTALPTRYESAAACEAGTRIASLRPITVESDRPLLALQCLRIDPATPGLVGAVEDGSSAIEAKPRAKPARRRSAADRGDG